MSSSRLSRWWLLVVVAVPVLLAIGLLDLVSPEPRYPGADPF